MVFVGVGEHETDDVAPLFDEKADVRQDQIDAGQMLLGGERHAAIDDQPCPPPPVADAVDREIHSDLADAAERREQKLGAGHQSTRPGAVSRPLAAPATGKTSPAATDCSDPSASRSNSRPRSSSPSPRPRISLPGSRTRISPMPAARAIQSARMPSNPAPRRHWPIRRAIVADSATNRLSAEMSAPASLRSVAG